MIGRAVPARHRELPRVLIAAPGAPDRDLLQRLNHAGFSAQETRSAEQIPAALAEGNVIAVVLEMPGAADPPRVARVVASAGTTPVVVLTSERSERSEHEIRRAGAAEVLAADERDALADVLRHLQPPATPASRPPEAAPLPAAAPLAWGAVALGGLVLGGWWLGLRDLTHVLPGLPAMKANTALMFVLLGSAVGLAAGRRAHP